MKNGNRLEDIEAGAQPGQNSLIGTLTCQIKNKEKKLVNGEKKVNSQSMRAKVVVLADAGNALNIAAMLQRSEEAQMRHVIVTS